MTAIMGMIASMFWHYRLDSRHSIWCSKLSVAVMTEGDVTGYSGTGLCTLS